MWARCGWFWLAAALAASVAAPASAADLTPAGPPLPPPAQKDAPAKKHKTKKPKKKSGRGAASKRSTAVVAPAAETSSTAVPSADGAVAASPDNADGDGAAKAGTPLDLTLEKPAAPPAVVEASAAPPPPTAPVDADQGATTTRWYGWQTIVPIAAGWGLAFGGAQQKSVTLTGVGAGVQVVGAPVLHFVHGRVGAGLASLGIEAIVPALGLSVGALVSAAQAASATAAAVRANPAAANDPAVVALRQPLNIAFAQPTVIGYSAGVLAAAILDVAVLSWSTSSARSEEHHGEPRPDAAAVTFPTVAIAPGGASVAWSGRF